MAKLPPIRLPPPEMPRMSDRQKIAKAMDDCEKWVIEFEYCDSKDNHSRRVVSPVRWTRDKRSFVALCLVRQECRTFTLERCSNVLLGKACDHVMPVDLD